MEHDEPILGFWIPVTDRPSAEYAAKMSGLPVFLMGLNFVALGLISIFSAETSFQIAIIITILLGGVFMTVSSLQIRKLKFRTLPISVGMWFVLTAAQMIFIGIGLGTILTILIGIMAMCGLRGWHWLRTNPLDVFD